MVDFDTSVALAPWLNSPLHKGPTGFDIHPEAGYLPPRCLGGPFRGATPPFGTRSKRFTSANL